LPRAALKPPKVYFFDNGDVLGDDGTRFENLIAISLLKRLHFLENRTVIVMNCGISVSLLYYAKRLNPQKGYANCGYSQIVDYVHEYQTDGFSCSCFSRGYFSLALSHRKTNSFWLDRLNLNPASVEFAA